MDIRSIEAKAPVVEHNGTVRVWWMIKSGEYKDITDGGYLELVNEFEVPGGGLVDPHSHPTHEFSYVMNGKGVMTIDGETARSRRATWCTSRPTRCTRSARSATMLRSTASASRSVSRAPAIDYTTH